MHRIKIELEEAGVKVDDIYDLVNTSIPYPNAIPVLLNLLNKGIENDKLKEGVIRSLAVKEAIGKATPILIEEFKRTPKEKMLLRWAIGNTVYITITESDLDGVLPIVVDKENGMSRQMFVAALGKVKSDISESVLIKLLDDTEVVAHALEALGRLKSKKAIQKISILSNQSKGFIKKEAQKALKKIGDKS